MFKLFNSSLEKKILYFGMVLALISVMLTTVTCYFVSFRLILSQFERVNEIATGAAVEKTNTYLGEIANIISMSMKNEYFDRLVNYGDSDNYQLIKAQKDYEVFLKNLIQNNDRVDAVILADKDSNTFISASNAVGKDYLKYGSEDFQTRLQKLLKESSESQFFLDWYNEKNYERIAVISPVFEPFGNKMQAYMVVILSGKLSQEMQFAGDGIYISDNAGNSAAIIYGQKPDTADDGEFSFNNRLNFHGWIITNTFTFDKLRSSIYENLRINILIGILCLLLSLLPLAVISKKIVHPIRNMEVQISELNHGIIENKPIVFSGRTVSFKLTLLILYSAMVTIPVVLITGSSYLSARSTVENKVGSVFEYSADILYQQMGFIFDNNRKTIIELSATNDKVQRLLNSREASGIAAEDNQIRDEMNNIILSRNLFDKGISNIAIYDAHEGLVYSSSYGRPFMMRPEIKTDLEYVRKNFGTFLWRSFTESSFNTKGIRIGMQIRGAADGVESGKLLGFLLVDFNAESIEKMLNVFLRYTDVGIYLMDKTGIDVLGSNSRNDAESMSGILKNYLSAPLWNGRVSIRQEEDSYLMISKVFDENQWRLVFLLKNFNENRQILFYSIAVLGGLIILSFAASYGFSYIVSFNITSLMKTVRKVKGGDLKVRFKSMSRDELGELGNSFNEMLERLGKLIDEKYISEVEMKDAQLKAKEFELNLLQAQINPHFLYNTLKTAQYMAFSKDPRTERMIKLLISLFKTGITRGEKLVKVSDEIAYVRTYVDIQQMRFSDKFKVIYDVSGELMDAPVLKLTMQPIVENAIYHGLEVTEDGGTIIVNVRSMDNKLKITVSDDGVGMTPEKLAELRNQLAGKIKGKSIGIINIHERIKLYFGGEYGIEVDSAAGKGSVVTIWFPLIAGDTPV